MADAGEAGSVSLAGLTQKQAIQATEAVSRHGHKDIARLGAGHAPNPSVRLVLDCLRACGARLTDIRAFLDGCLSARLSAPERRQR